MVRFLYSAFSDESGEATLQGQIDACKRNGITHMELRGFGKDPNINNITTEKAKELRAILDKNGMRLSAIGSAYGKIKIKDDFAPHFEAFKNTIEVAKILGAPYIRIFSFYFDHDDDYAANRDEVLRRVQAMADYGYEQGVLCCHENEKGIYGDNAERCLDLLQNVRHLRGVFDPAVFEAVVRVPARVFDICAVVIDERRRFGRDLRHERIDHHRAAERRFGIGCTRFVRDLCRTGRGSAAHQHRRAFTRAAVDRDRVFEHRHARRTVKRERADQVRFPFRVAQGQIVFFLL